MGLLGRYIFREIFTSSVLGTLLATFVVFLQGVDKLFEVLVRASNAGPRIIITLFALSMPPVLPLTIPFGILVGILIGLGRMAADGEITAMRAAGVPSRKVIAPVMLFAVAGCGLAAVASLRLTPYAYRETTRIRNELLASQLSADIQPRVFDEDFPNTILYVGEVLLTRPGDPVLWRNVFIADVTPPEQRKQGMGDKADGPLVSVARQAVALSDPRNNRLQLAMYDRYLYEMGKDRVSHNSFAPNWRQALDAKPPDQTSLKSSALNTRQLMAKPNYYGPDWINVRTELHRRFALPVACLMLALVGIPLGIATRKGGKSAGYVIAVFLGFFCYHLSYVSLTGLAKRQVISVPAAAWLPDVAFGLAGLIFLIRMDLPGDRDLLGRFQGLMGSLLGMLRSKTGRPMAWPRLSNLRTPLLPQIVDTYVLSSFLFYLVVVLASFVSMILMYNFFELMSDMIQHSSLSVMFTYLFFLTPKLIYDTLPISVLVAVLVNFSVLGKQNEITAFKACGVSLYRLSLPILIGSTVLSAGLFAFDYYYVPGANRKQDALRDEIKGRPRQSYLNPDRKWIMGAGSRIYYYKYFDPAAKVMAGVDVFELEPGTFRLTRQILAESAQWDPTVKPATWIFKNGWSCDFQKANEGFRHDFQVTTFNELTEPPDYFLKDPPQDKQMSFLELDRYIRDLQQSGFDTVRLQVQFYRKFAVPLIVLIMAMIAASFGMSMGNRGAMTGIGIGIAIALSYWGISTLFEKIGGVNQLPPAMAAWAPDVVFGLAGLYLLLQMRS